MSREGLYAHQQMVFIVFIILFILFFFITSFLVFIYFGDVN